jgi:hypothetical protein
MKSSCETSIDHPAASIDLVEWFENFSDREYQACSTGHRAAGAFRENGTFGTVNVENVGGHLLIQHYLAEKFTPNHVVMYSRNSRAYLMHLVPVTIEVIWTLEVEHKDSKSALFRCTVEARMPAVLTVLATLAALPFFLRRHVEEEAPLFARDIARKISRAPPKAVEAS